jgi:hypothetical protein
MTYRIEISQSGEPFSVFPTKYEPRTLASASRIIRSLRVFYPKASWRIGEIEPVERVDPKLPDRMFPAQPSFVFRRGAKVAA